ncbi:CheR family methyltransferase [Pedobacter xixiisoli]|uniref:Chemotaxis protein methyltransferase CheR n=1 Tax=Pedobacter xixiisoli TaxID=1476464 RepID=A0A286A8S3_9SPHI|nr:protein-glutamate O-methyltransferase CheR [Pedobacter xixiisoli]SOD18282.1 chemotaxis protein methyltransferase CheR [Pedobacter xixiisoli]
MTKELITDEQVEEIVIITRNIYGFDFEGYSRASLKRRLDRIMLLKRLDFFDLRSTLTNNEDFFHDFLNEVTVNVTEMFRDPKFFKSLKENVIPYLSSYPHLKVWNAGCSTGEELYSFTILFEELGLYDRSFFYGTDINHKVLETAREGIYDLQKMKQYSENYHAIDGGKSLSNYYTAQYDAASISRHLKKNVLFSMHNLVSDGPFNEFQVISCRNVLIYFNPELQKSVINLFYNSLANFGFLCLGGKEAIRDYQIAKKFKAVDKKNNIYQKIS